MLLPEEPIESRQVKRKRQTGGALKLLVHLYFANEALVERHPTRHGYYCVPSVARMAKLLGVPSVKVRGWLTHLEDHGYLIDVQYSPSHRQVYFRFRPLRNS